jgi:hypothetical protein
LWQFSEEAVQTKAIVFLASNWSEMITGVALEIDGGMHLGWVDWETYLSKHKSPVKLAEGK